MPARKRVIGIIGAGEGALDGDIASARSLGELAAREGWVVLTGGRDAGIMAAACEGAKKVDGSITVGVLPGRESDVSADVDIRIVTDMGSGRNNVNVLSSDVVVACGATGAGTVSEIALAIKARRPMVIITDDPLARDFFAQLGGALVSFASSAEEAIALIRHHLT